MKSKRAFTFVELIVVITILAILATIGLGTYQSYLADGRDTNRLLQLSDIYDGLELYSINSRLPFPEDLVEIQASGNTFAYQGFAGENIIKTIGYDGGGKDIEHGSYLTYTLGSNQRDFQLMTYVDESELLSEGLVHQSYAIQNYQEMFPKVIGLPLGVLVNEITNAPIQADQDILSVGRYDIITDTDVIKVYRADKDILSFSSGDDFSTLIPNSSCKRILELGRSKGNGSYVISQDGTTSMQVYCDMETDGGGWTFAGFIHEASNTNNIYFDRDFGGYDTQRTSSGSSYMLDLSKFSDSQALFLYNTNNIIEAEESDNLIIFKYSIDLPGMNIGPLSLATDETIFGGLNGIEYRTSFTQDWSFTRNRSGGWGFDSSDRTQNIIQIRSNSRGVEKYTGLWGDPANERIRDNAAYIYIR